MMKKLYDISMLFLRCLRDFEKWSWIEKIGKNWEKWLSQNPQIYTTHHNY